MSTYTSIMEILRILNEIMHNKQAFVDHMENSWEGKEGAFACPQCSGIPSNVKKEVSRVGR